jgi:hypothetical protein
MEMTNALAKATAILTYSSFATAFVLRVQISEVGKILKCCQKNSKLQKRTQEITKLNNIGLNYC